MTSIETRISIEAPASKVWSILTDFAEMPAWNPFIRAISGSLIAGERLIVTVAPPGQRVMTFQPTVLAATPGRELRWLGGFIGRWLLPASTTSCSMNLVPPNPLDTWRTFLWIIGTIRHARRDTGGDVEWIHCHE
jgi:Polyketide cyclase / dehydrase and lipid transport